MTRQQQAEVIAKEVEGLNSLATPEDFIVLGVTYKWCEVAICKDGVNRKVGIFAPEEFVRAKGENTL